MRSVDKIITGVKIIHLGKYFFQISPQTAINKGIERSFYLLKAKIKSSFPVVTWCKQG